MEIVIRRLTKHEVTKLRNLNALFSGVFNDSENYARHKPEDAYLATFLENLSNIVLVAENDEGEVVGGLVAYVLTKFEQERKEVYLYDLAVTKNFQQRGIGRKLMDELRHVVKGFGAYIVFVQADEGDDAVYFYQSLHPTGEIRARSFDFEV